MKDPIKITASIPAFVSDEYALRRFTEALEKGDASTAVDVLNFSQMEMDKGISDPWTRIGVATITLEVSRSRDELVAAQVENLQAELERARAAWLTLQAEIQARISKLTALTYEPA